MYTGRQLIILVLLYCCTLFGKTPMVHANEIPDNEPVLYELGHIEVIGIREKTKTSPVTILTKKNFLEKLNENVVETIQNTPGIVTTVGFKNEPQFLLRGIRQERVLILFDGVPIAAPYYGDLDTSELPLNGMAEISVVRGNASVLYGPNALAGVVSMVSSKPGHQPNFSLLTSVDHIGNNTSRFAHGLQIGSFYYQVSGGYRNSQGWPMSQDFSATYDEDENELENGDIREHSAFHQWSGNLKAGYLWGENEISFVVHHVDGDKEIPPATQPDTSIRYWDFPVWKKSSAIFAGKSRLSENLDLRMNVFYHKYDNVLRNYKDPGYSEIRWESTYDDYSAGLNTRLAWQMTDNVIIRGAVSGTLDNHRVQGDIGDPWEQYDAGTYSLATEAEWIMNNQWSALSGLSGEIYDFQDSNNVPGEADAIEERTKDVQALSFNVGTRFQPLEGHSFGLSLAKRNRFPTMHQLFSNIEEYESQDVGRLDAESALQYQVNYRFQPVTATILEAAVYRYEIDNLIDRPNKDALYDNTDKVLFQGFELMGMFGGETGIKAILSYTYSQATNESRDRLYTDLPYVPSHSIRTEIGYMFDMGLALTLGYSYRDEVFEYDSDYKKSTVPAYSLVDCSIHYNLPYNLGITLRGENLLDEDYYSEYGYNLPGRIIKLGLSYQL